MNLYELSKDFRRIENMLDEAQEEGAEGAEALLLQIRGMIETDSEETAAQVVRSIRNDEAVADAIDDEIKRLKAKKAARENRIEAKRRYLRDFLKSVGKTKLDALIAKVSLRAGSTSLVVDETKIQSWPKDLYHAALETGAVQIIESYKVSKTALKNIPGYDTLPGVTEVVGEESITIR